MCVCVREREREREREIPVECQVGSDTNTTLQPDSGGQGADASGERRATQLPKRSGGGWWIE